MIPRWLAVTPRDGEVDAALVELWSQHLVGRGLAVLARMSGHDPNIDLAPGGRLAPLRSACQATGIAMLCSSATGHDELALAAASRWSLSGVQLRGDPSTERVERVRDALPEGLVGASVHGEPRPLGPLDYACLAPIFTPRTPAAAGRSPKRGVGLDMLRTWADQTTVPLLALGGIDASNAGACLTAGAQGIASISTFFGPRAEVVENLRLLASS